MWFALVLFQIGVYNLSTITYLFDVISMEMYIICHFNGAVYNFSSFYFDNHFSRKSIYNYSTITCFALISFQQKELTSKVNII